MSNFFKRFSLKKWLLMLFLSIIVILVVGFLFNFIPPKTTIENENVTFSGFLSDRCSRGDFCNHNANNDCYKLIIPSSIVGISLDDHKLVSELKNYVGKNITVSGDEISYVVKLNPFPPKGSAYLVDLDGSPSTSIPCKTIDVKSIELIN